MAFPNSVDDPKRLQTLADFAILDTPAEQGYDDIVELAAELCNAPVALVSLVAADRQWFKARVGFEPCETDINSSVCAFALTEPDVLVIPDLAADSRTAQNPLVTANPHIRFYAGVPLRAPNGATLGSLCVIDDKPRPEGLSPTQREQLKRLARQVMAQLDLRRALFERDAAEAKQEELERLRKETETQYRLLFEGIDTGFCIIEMKFEGETPVDYKFVEVNPAFAAQSGLTDAQGRWMRDLAPNHEQHWFDLYGRVAMTGEPIHFENPAKELDDRWYEVRAFRVGNPQARQVGILLNDISDRKRADAFRAKAEAAQDVLNAELSHRMKNTFAMVQAVATQTLRSVPDQVPVEAFTERLHALSTAHDVLLQKSWAAAELGDVMREVLGTLAPLDRFTISGPPVQLGPRTTLSLSLLLHELSTNALKYGALSMDRGHINATWQLRAGTDDTELVLVWNETGGPVTQGPTRRGFGSRLIRLGLVGTGGAELRYEPSGFSAEFTAPLAQVQSS